jgi:RsiW-degrading membrane proteinase PrsW (M82 family)
MRLIRLVLDTGIWAPLLVLILHEVLHSREWKQQIDWFNHFSGGLAFSFFIWKSVPFVERWFGSPTPMGRLAVAFLSGCTAALIWEIIEFSSDCFLHTRIQQNIQETMIDIVNGFLGTCLTTIMLLLLNFLRNDTAPNQAP